MGQTHVSPLIAFVDHFRLFVLIVMTNKVAKDINNEPGEAVGTLLHCYSDSFSFLNPMLQQLLKLSLISFLHTSFKSGITPLNQFLICLNVGRRKCSSLVHFINTPETFNDNMTDNIWEIQASGQVKHLSRWRYYLPLPFKNFSTRHIVDKCWKLKLLAHPWEEVIWNQLWRSFIFMQITLK